MESESKYEADGLMDTSTLKKFAQEARRQLREQVRSKLELVLKEGSLARRESTNSVEDLEEAIANASKEAVVDRVAYTWFNRLCALRFMDVNHYTKIKAVSSAQGFTQPEVLAEAKQGHVDDSLEHFINKKKVLGIISGSEPSKDPEQEAYRLLLVATCNYYNHVMPFLFQKIDDYSELLIPADLLSESSILTSVRNAMTEEACQDVEVIGWLYQFYISEKKDEVFAALKKGKKITPENIPAATQLFTPHWIVRYLVENSLGRLWMLNHPNSQLIEQMEYYIEPEQDETDFLKISKPEEIKVCDPACGSGHMLTYAFDLLFAIYEEEGYEANEIPRLILENNLYGIEIDERAGELAAFALTMKAREKYKRFFSKAIQPNICVLENIQFDEGKLKEYMDFIGRDLFTAPLQTTLCQFEEADNFGSLIRPDVTNVVGILKILEDKNVSEQLFLSATHRKVLQALQQADYLSPKYQVVVANPPYVKSKNFNPVLKRFAEKNYPEGCPDLYGCFIQQNRRLTIPNGHVAMITIPNWMFLSSFSDLRRKLIEETHFTTVIHNGRGVWGADFGSCEFSFVNRASGESQTLFRRLFKRTSEVRTNEELQKNFFDTVEFPLFFARCSEFRGLPDCIFAYWLSNKIKEVFADATNLEELGIVRQGFQTGDNDRFLRQWFEVSRNKAIFEAANKEEVWKEFKWVPYNKGGKYRKWYGNNDFVVAFDRENYDVLTVSGNCLPSKQLYFREGVTWSALSISLFSARYSIRGATFSAKGACSFPPSESIPFVLAILNSIVAKKIFEFLAATVDFNVGSIRQIPLPKKMDDAQSKVTSLAKQCVALVKDDWDISETSWDFTSCRFIKQCDTSSLAKSIRSWIQFCEKQTNSLRSLEQDLNELLISAYSLEKELAPEVNLKHVALNVNPFFRYDADKPESELEALLLADTMREFISYAVGCMLGRYSLDKPGLILANQGETIEDYRKQIPEPTFEADNDNVIPFLDKGYFSDDVTERFYKFLKVTFDEEHFDENLKFIEKAIGKDVRKYFLKDFYSDHIKRYKKRPIYWMFSSPKGTFNVLIYMHRYRPDTVSIVLNDYLREFRTKLTARRDHLGNVKIDGSASQREQTQAIKELETIKKQVEELNDYEHDILYPLATQKIEIDLDDGVKTNYPKFGKALQKILGLSETKKAEDAAS